MNVSQVTLTQLPYTGFDYGIMYNSLFWVGLLVWSLVVAAIFLKNKIGIGKMFSNLVKVFILERKTDIQFAENDEPVILQERVVRYDPLADVQTQPIVPSETVAMPIVDEDAEKLVKDIIKEELSISREGESQDEFSQDDFSTADFDGVNPDVYWQPRVTEIREPENVTNVVSEDKSIGIPEVVEERIVKADVRAGDADKKVFLDKITLDKDGEYPKIILSRTQVS